MSNHPAARRAVVAALVAGAMVLAGCGGAQAKREAAGLDPEGSPADIYVNMAAAYYQRGQLDSALDRGLRALQEDKRNADAHYVLAIVYQRLGKRVDAERHFEEALRLDPDNPEYLNARGTILCTQGRYDAAIEQFDAAAANRLYATPEVALMNASDCSRRAGRGTNAERYLREALSRNANYPPALLAMARLNFDRGDYPSARQYMGRYGQVGRASPSALLLAHRIEARLGNGPAAKALADALRRQYPDAPEVMEL